MNHNVFHRDGRYPAPRLNTDCGQTVEVAWVLDGRRVNQFRARRPAGHHAHAVVRGDERFAVGGRAGNRLRHIGDGDRRSGDPVPTLQQFIDDVHAGKVSYYVEAGRGPNVLHGEVIRGLNHSASHTREVADWVAAHYFATTIGGSTVYRLT
jgi:hypothetical protein